MTIASVGLAPGAAAADVQSQQWYLDAMGAEQMWKSSTGKGVKVAVIDSGVNPATSSLKGQVLADEVPKSVSYHVTQDYAGHGTTIAEMIAGTGAGGGIKGLAPGAKIVPYRVPLKGLKDGEETEKTSTPAEAIKAAADSDAKIINMSFGGPLYDPKEKEAIKYAASKGKLMFSAVGNDAQKNNKVDYPAFYPYVNGVAAVDRSGTVGKFSEYGSYIDFAAPGLDVPVWCDNTFTKHCTSDGTSASSAIASASAALIWSAHPNWTANQVLRTLIDTAGRSWPKNKPSKYLGYGLVRPGRVLADKNIDPGPADTDPLAAENVSDDDASASAPPSSSASTSSEARKDNSGGATSAAVDSSESSGDNTQLWVVIGAAAAVALLGGGAFAAVRARRGR